MDDNSRHLEQEFAEFAEYVSSQKAKWHSDEDMTNLIEGLTPKFSDLRAMIDALFELHTELKDTQRYADLMSTVSELQLELAKAKREWSKEIGQNESLQEKTKHLEKQIKQLEEETKNQAELFERYKNGLESQISESSMLIDFFVSQSKYAQLDKNQFRSSVQSKISELKEFMSKKLQVQLPRRNEQISEEYKEQYKADVLPIRHFLLKKLLSVPDGLGNPCGYEPETKLTLLNYDRVNTIGDMRKIIEELESFLEKLDELT